MKKLNCVTETNGLRFNNLVLFADGEGAYELTLLDSDGECSEQDYIEASEVINILRSHQKDLRRWRKFSWSV